MAIADLRQGRLLISEILKTAAGSSASSGCDTTGGEGKASSGTSADPGDMPAEIWEKVKNHLCHSEEAHHHHYHHQARLHVAVTPAGNIPCHYCKRKYDFSNEAA